MKNKLKQTIIALAMAVTLTVSGQSSLAREVNISRIQMAGHEAQEQQGLDTETNRYQIHTIEDGAIVGDAINNISEENWCIYMWLDKEEAKFPIIKEIKEGDIIEIEFEGEEQHQIKSISIIGDVLRYHVSQIEYYDEAMTEGYIFLQPNQEDRNIMGMGIHLDINEDTLKFIGDQMGDYMDRYEIGAIEEGDMMLLTINEHGVSKILTIY